MHSQKTTTIIAGMQTNIYLGSLRKVRGKKHKGSQFRRNVPNNNVPSKLFRLK